VSYRYDDLAPGEVYHIYTRGVEQRDIFRNNTDRGRFIELLVHCLPKERIVSYSLAKKFNHEIRLSKEGRGLIDLIAYCLMSNHFHLLVKENVEGGTSRYMHRLLTAYARYINISEQRSGSLFVNPFQAVLVDGDEQLLQVSRYIHLNPFKAKMITQPFDYNWSSLREHVGDTSKLTCHVSLLTSLLNPADYREFIIDQADYLQTLNEASHLLLDNNS